MKNELTSNSHYRNVTNSKPPKTYEKNTRSFPDILLDCLGHDRFWRRESFRDTGPNPNADSFSQGPAVDTSSVIVQLKGDPLSTISAAKPAAGRRIDFKNSAATSYRAQLSAGRNDFRKWLQANAPGATITNEYDITLNGVAVELNGDRDFDHRRGADGGAGAGHSVLYHPDLSQSYQIINAVNAWNAAGGRSVAWTGIKIGDIDTGIDETHPFFDSTGFSYPPGFPKCDKRDSNSHQQDQDCNNVSPKVIVAKIFYGRARQEGLDAQAVQDHGSHTAGIAAGVTGKTAVVNGVSVSDMSGIAPGAWLGNYNVFPGAVLNARDVDIASAVEAAVEDGMDVLNLSLGGFYTGKEQNDMLSRAVNNAVSAGLVVAVAAGATVDPAHSLLSLRGVRAKSSRSPPAQTNTSSGSRSPIRQAAEQRSARQSVTSRPYLQLHSTCSTPTPMAAPALTPALQGPWQSLTEEHACSARRSRAECAHQ